MLTADPQTRTPIRVPSVLPQDVNIPYLVRGTPPPVVRPIEPIARLGRSATLECLVRATRGALLHRERLIAAGEYFVKDLRYSRDVAVPVALSRLAAEGVSPTLRQQGPFDVAQARAILQLYRALKAEQRKDEERLAGRDDLRGPIPVSDSGPLTQAIRRAVPASPPPFPRPYPNPHRVVDHRLAVAVSAVVGRPCPAPTDFSPSGSWRSTQLRRTRLSLWSSVVASGTAAMVVTTVLVRAAWTLMS